MHLPESARALIKSGAHAHLTALNPDGSPHVTLVWAGIDGDDILTAHLYANKKVQNIPRVHQPNQGQTYQRRWSLDRTGGVMKTLISRGCAYG